MIINIVHVHVKKGEVEKFREASIENALNSIKEPGFLKFDILQREDDPHKFIFYEVYRDADVPLRHKETPHYLKWRGIVDNLMEETRYGVKYKNCFPEDTEWE